MQFSEAKLASLLKTALEKDSGVSKLTAGGSTLTVTKLGPVTVTEAFWCVGAYNRANIHYFDPSTGLKFTQKREDNADAYATLQAIIFGHKLPGIWSPHDGAEQDKLQGWLKRYAWTLAGEAGMRAQAKQHQIGLLDQAVSSAADSLSYDERRLENLTSQTADTFRDRHERIRSTSQDTLACLDTQLAETDVLITPEQSEEDLRGAALNFGACRQYERGSSDYRFGWPGIPATSTPIHQSANYSATLDGDTIRLSSGIVCEFSLPAVLEWLRGEATAPVCRYGAVRRIECADSAGDPLILLACGCHRIDARGLTPELDALLVPTHSVNVVPATPAVYLEDGKEVFLARLRTEIQMKKGELIAQRAAELTAFIARKHELEEEERNLPARIAEKEILLATMRAEVDKAKADRDSANIPLGATLANTNAAVLAAVTSLLTRRNLGT